MLKTLVAGEASGSNLADRLRLPFSILDALIQHARVEKLIEVRGTSGAGSAGYRYALTDLGRDRAGQFLDLSRYIGPAPVPLAQYNAYVRACMAARPYVDKDKLSTGFEQLIVSKPMLDQLGPAVNSGKSLFLYGAPGNGKTVIAEGIGRALGDEMFVPHAMDVDGQIITMFDPVNHTHLGGVTGGMDSVVAAAQHDRRWERIKRPVVVVGGELTLEMLDLIFNPISKFYEAPIQLKANGGVFVVDDFGRQRIPPRDLLNRWIVPLESRVDFLTLHTGRKFETPFNVLIVFATNLKPESLADEAFLRRIPYKILAKNPTLDEYCRIFELNCNVAGCRSIRSWSSICSASTTSRASCRCAPAIPATSSIRSSTCAGTTGASRRSRASCSTRPAAATSSRNPIRRGASVDETSRGFARRFSRADERSGAGPGSTAGSCRQGRPPLHRRPVHADGGQPGPRFLEDRETNRLVAAGQRSAGRRLHRVPACAAGGRSQHPCARADDRVPPGAAARAARSRRRDGARTLSRCCCLPRA